MIVLAETTPSDVIETTGDPVAPEEAMAWFRQRVPLQRSVWNVLDEQARRRAFTVAGVTSLDVLHEVWRAMDRAIASGVPFAEFQREVRGPLAQAWGEPGVRGAPTTSGQPRRMETIFRNNAQSAYAAGRFAQATDPQVAADRPVWQFEAVMDVRTTDICRPLDQTRRLATDAWWSTHYPPLHHNCRSTVITLDEEQAHEAGGMSPPQPGDPPADGWGHTPNLSEWHPAEHDYPPQLWDAYTHWNSGRPQPEPAPAPPPPVHRPPRHEPTPPAEITAPGRAGVHGD